MEVHNLEQTRKRRLAKASLSLMDAEKAVGLVSFPNFTGGVWHVEGGNAPLFEAVATLRKDEHWVGFAAVKNVGWCAASEYGIPLEKVIFVPQLGAQPLKVLAALIDGVDLVVAGPFSLSAQNQRVLAGRARSRKTTILTTVRWLSVSKPWSLSAKSRNLANESVRRVG